MMLMMVEIIIMMVIMVILMKTLLESQRIQGIDYPEPQLNKKALELLLGILTIESIPVVPGVKAK